MPPGYLSNLAVTLVFLSGFYSVNGFATAHVPSLELHLGLISNDTIMDGDDELTFGLSGRFTPESLHPDLRLYFELWSWGTDFPNTGTPTCFFCAGDEVDIDVTTIGLGLAAIYPLQSLQFYAQAGLAYTKIGYNLGGSIFGILLTAEEDSNSKITLQYGFGVVYVTDQSSLGVHFRHFDIESSSATFSIEDIDVGGNYVGFSYGWNY